MQIGTYETIMAFLVSPTSALFGITCLTIGVPAWVFGAIKDFGGIIVISSCLIWVGEFFALPSFAWWLVSP